MSRMRGLTTGMASAQAQQSSGESGYRAFISYSHRDEAVATRLHRWLEGYRMPRRLVGQDTAFGPIGRRLTPIFRDRLELPAASDLNTEVKQALGASRALLVLCSPAARASRWVDAEIRQFRAHYPDRPVIAALIEGEPQESFPAALTEPDGAGKVIEPIAADFRKGQDGPKLARLKIVAGLTGVALDQLIQREAQRQMRRVIAVTVFALLLVLFMALMLTFVLRAQHEADRQRHEAEGLIEFMLTDLRDRLKGVGRLDVLQTVNERALAYYGDQSDLAELPVDSLERRARILHAMGEDDQRRGDYEAAIQKFREARRVTGTLLASAPDDPRRIFTHAQSEFWIGYVDFILHHYPQALSRFTAYRDLAQRLIQLEPDNPANWRELAYAQGNICSVAIRRGGPQGDLEECRNALATMERIAKAEPRDPGVLADLANRHAWVADALRLRGRDQEALGHRERQSTIIQGLLRQDPRNMSYMQDMMLAQYSTSQILFALGRRDDAARLRDAARETIERLIKADPENQDWMNWKTKIERPLTS